eukprot:Sspe_Gene.39724::Locus_19152_Transcript_1_1_Confidence_1.000_Length_2876::g.39724::m.39724/K14152/HIS4; phosphoribosyl-ATP pyrophosphohydrolase / phosphoribosyl-AMP cyclohydrolase / histidinol dehydrogenase
MPSTTVSILLPEQHSPIPDALRAALITAGAAKVEGVSSSEAVSDATHLVVLPSSNAQKEIENIKGRIKAGKPVLAIGEAAPEVLCVLHPEVAPIETPPEAVRKWHRMASDGRCTMLKPGTAYFEYSAQSLRSVPVGWPAAWTEDGDNSLVAGVEKDSLVAVLFSPEKSGGYGRSFLSRWIRHTSPNPPPSKEVRRKGQVAGLLVVSADGVQVGMALDKIPYASLRSSTLPTAWEAAGCDYFTILAEPNAAERVAEVVAWCTSNCTLPVMCQALSHTDVKGIISAGASSVLAEVGSPGFKAIEQAVAEHSDPFALVPLVSARPAGEASDVESASLFSITSQVGDDVKEWEWVASRSSFDVASFRKEMEGVANPFANMVLMLHGDGGEAYTRLLSQISDVLPSAPTEVWIAGPQMGLSNMVELMGSSNVLNVVRYPMQCGAAPAKVKGAMLAANIDIRTDPSGMQYGSTNIQCVVPCLEVSNAGVTSITADGPQKLPGTLEDHIAAYSVVGEITVLNIDASLNLAKGAEATRAALLPLFKKYRIRVGGGVRGVDDALDILNEGASKVIVGYHHKDLLPSLPRDRVVVSIDAVLSSNKGEDKNDMGTWVTQDGMAVQDAVTEVTEHAGHVLLTFLEPASPGLDLAFVKQMASACKAAKADLTVAGPICTKQAIAVLDDMGVECHIPTAVLGNVDRPLPISSAITSIIKSDRLDGLFATVVVDEANGRPLGMCYSNLESIHQAITRRRGIYWSRQRGLWVKGETSGDVQQLVSVGVDCDRDCLQFVVKQSGTGFCHRQQHTCFGPAKGLDKLMHTLQQRMVDAPPGSYTKKLFNDSKFLGSKLREEADELAESPNADNCAFEAADLLYFAMTRCTAMGVGLSEIQSNLDFKSRKVKRRPGNTKPQYVKKEGEKTG